MQRPCQEILFEEIYYSEVVSTCQLFLFGLLEVRPPTRPFSKRESYRVGGSVTTNVCRKSRLESTSRDEKPRHDVDTKCDVSTRIVIT